MSTKMAYLFKSRSKIVYVSRYEGENVFGKTVTIALTGVRNDPLFHVAMTLIGDYCILLLC